ncbi:phytanoyl-CoA dioxygenase family protein [Geminicoccus flavidas]|uniref:hypothetical protein n=1 Tax=Geminicoccus flavidas TaxID=2506407 RepID=UPI00135B5239|nr:hypothetical protein [Geminicoccus flavidas]
MSTWSDNEGGSNEAVPDPSRDIEVHGYHIVRSAFSEQEIQTLRKKLASYFRRNGTYRHGGKIEWRGIHKLPELADIIISDRLLEALRACTSPDDPVLTGESDLQLNTLSRWHKDIDQDGELKELVGRPDGWRVCKVAVYLQDQPAHSRQALKVRPGSHRRRLGEVTQEVALGVRAGDVIVFDVRIDHAGQFPSWWDKSLHRLSVAGSRVLKGDPESRFAALREALCGWGGRTEDRMAIYLTFGSPNAATYAYEQAGRRNHGPVPAALDSEARSRLARWNVTMIGAAS